MALIGNPIVVGYNNAGQGQGYGLCSTSTTGATAKDVTLANYNLQAGGIVAVKFQYNNTATSMTLNINNKGPISVLYRGSSTIDATLINAGDIATFIYDGTNYQLISVDRWGNSPNFLGTPTAPTAAVGTNTTQIATTEFVQSANAALTPANIGFGFGTCASEQSPLLATLTGYALKDGAMPTVKFTYAVPSQATLNINSTGAKSIYILAAGMLTKVPANLIKAGDYVTFIYNGSYYVVHTILRQVKEVSGYGNITSLSIEEVSS